MNLLAPLYIAGALAVALPIIFHLIKRTPENKQDFSSLMFLAPSPPRLTRRSRLTNILLLLLRAAALCLLAFAFARPFFQRNVNTAISPTQGRRIALLVDTSASMRRGDLWDQTERQVDQAITDVQPADEVALFFFDRQVKPVITFTQWNELDPSRRAAVLNGQMDQSSPSWEGTNLGESLAAVADQLSGSETSHPESEKIRRQIVLISDLQQGAHVESLQNHQWPANVLLEVKPVALKQTTNAGVQLIKPAADAPDTLDDRVRVRVSNQIGSGAEQFTLAWANDKGVIPSITPQKLYVVPGRSQIVSVPWPNSDQNPDRLVLGGDDFNFDNTLYVVRPRQRTIRIVYLGDDEANDIKGLNYYLRSAVPDSTARKSNFIQKSAKDSLADTDLTGAALVVNASPVAADRSAVLRHFMDEGGTVVWVLRDAASAQGLSAMLGIDSLPVAESADRDFALLGRVDLDHPLFSPFSDARFADFTKIHFWKHRKVTLPEGGARVIAAFDNSDPFMFEKVLGKGRLIVATSGWQPSDSQLALSTKFVPLIGNMLQKHDDEDAVETQYTVGDKTPLVSSEQPGVYQAQVKGATVPVAVNLSPDESRTTPVTVADLEQWGAKLVTNPPPEQIAATERLLQQSELENRQKMWRWLIVVVLGLLLAETLLAGRLARRPSAAGFPNSGVSS